MPRTLTAQDRSSMIRLAYSLPKGSPERKVVLQSLRGMVPPKARKSSLRGASGRNTRLDEGKYKDSIDLAFANYALNELSFFLEEGDKGYARENYGGLDGVVGGTIYSGGRIDSEKQLRELQDLKSGGNLTVHMKSFSHSKDVARDFAGFVKTYDPMLGALKIEEALKRGSAGKFGSYVLSVKADPKTILINTMRPDGVTSSAEPELIVDGSVKVLGVDIMAPLTKDNWAAETLDKWTSLEELGGSVFLEKWASANNIDVWPELEKFLNRVVRGPDDLAEVMQSRYDIITKNSLEISKWASRHPAASKLVKEIEISNDSRGGVLLTYRGVDILPGRVLTLRVLKEKGVFVLQKSWESYSEKLLRSLKAPPESYRGIMSPSPIRDLSYLLDVIDDLSEVGTLKKKHLAPVEKFNKWLRGVTKEVSPGNILQNLNFHKALLSNGGFTELKSLEEEGAYDPQESVEALRGYALKVYHTINSRGFSIYLNNLEPEDRRDLKRMLPILLEQALKMVTAL